MNPLFIGNRHSKSLDLIDPATKTTLRQRYSIGKPMGTVLGDWVFMEKQGYVGCYLKENAPIKFK